MLFPSRWVDWRVVLEDAAAGDLLESCPAVLMDGP